MDYDMLGLKVGLEIHQELDTDHKLFCYCPPKLFKRNPEYTFIRRLRASQSELGEIDPAALFEFIRGKTIVYEANRETSCLVEMDEEPPGPLNEEALDICLIFALMTNSRPVDEVHVMRKTVVDGSNTTGFQRTCVISLGGSIEVGSKHYQLEQICLEEDAARKIADEGLVSSYRIDRLGIPLIEVTTAPEIHSPKEAEEVALTIGRMLRATGRVRRGLGTIRQDINVSIEGGALIEIKGVQELELISKVVEYEAQRQENLLKITAELETRNVEPSDLLEEYVDVSDVFASTRCRVIRSALKKGEKVFALKIRGFGGLVGRVLCPNRRLGTEMADYARYWGGVRGIFHTDELPGYDISEEEVLTLRRIMTATERDSVIVVADEAEKCRRALSAVIDRAKEALVRIPSETRAANQDGTTHYTRPRPGAARMYPETDVVSISIGQERLASLRRSMPEMPEHKLSRFRADYGLNNKLARQVVDSDYNDIFEKLVRETEISPVLIAVTLTETFKSLKRDGIKIGTLSEKGILETFKLLENELMVKESLPEVFVWMASHADASPCKALRDLNLELMSQGDLLLLVEKKVRDNKELVEQMGERAQGPLMGLVMSEVRGKARAEDVLALIKNVIRDMTTSSKGSKSIIGLGCNN